jgi:hypothetical protein
LAHRFAIESDRIVADMVEVTEFPHLAQRYNVMGVPKDWQKACCRRRRSYST